MPIALVLLLCQGEHPAICLGRVKAPWLVLTQAVATAACFSHRTSHCRAPIQAVLGLPCSVGSSLSTSPKAPRGTDEVLLSSLILDVLADLILEAALTDTVLTKLSCKLSQPP